MSPDGGQEGGANALLASLPKDPGLLDGVSISLAQLVRAARLKAEWLIPNLISWALGITLILIGMASLKYALTHGRTSPDEHPWGATAAFLGLGIGYLGTAGRPWSPSWVFLGIAWPAFFTWVALMPGETGSSAGGVILVGLLFGAVHLWIAARIWSFRDVRQPISAWKELRLLKERMWLRTLDPLAPIASLTLVGPHGSRGSSGHLARVEGGWVLLLGEMLIPLPEGDLGTERDEIRICLTGRCLSFTATPSPRTGSPLSIP